MRTVLPPSTGLRFSVRTTRIWGSRRKYSGSLMRSLTPVGRVETLDDTLNLLGKHIASFGRDLPPIRLENSTPLPFPDGLLSDETVRIIREQYSPDYRAFGYDEPETSPPSRDTTQEWRDRTGILLEPVRAINLRNERLTTLDRSLQGTSRRVKKVQQGNEHLRRRLARRNEKLRRAEQELEELRGTLRSVRAKAEVREKHIARLRGQVATLDRKLQELHASRSWRLTAPLHRSPGAMKRMKRSLFR
jgi:hypothetical protein